jgi:membrane protein implicated in regulation of membrane protease activity
MLGVYLFSLVVGGGLLLFSVLGDVGHHGGDVEHAGDAPHQHDGFKFLSLRTLTYFLFGFGATGAGLSWIWSGSGWLALALAVSVGLALGGTSAAVFDYLRRGDSGGREGDQSFVGHAGRVTIPLSRGAPGKVLVRRGDRSFELLARPFGADAETPDRWTSVVVVEMRGGTAVVAPLEESANADD